MELLDNQDALIALTAVIPGFAIAGFVISRGSQQRQHYQQLLKPDDHGCGRVCAGQRVALNRRRKLG